MVYLGIGSVSPGGCGAGATQAIYMDNRDVFPCNSEACCTRTIDCNRSARASAATLGGVTRRGVCTDRWTKGKRRDERIKEKGIRERVGDKRVKEKRVGHMEKVTPSL